MKKPIIPVILGQIVIDSVIRYNNIRASNLGKNDKKKSLTVGGPASFTSSISLILSDIYSWIKNPIIFAYTCPKANMFLESTKKYGKLVKELKLQPICPHFRLIYKDPETERDLFLNNPPVYFNPNDFNWKQKYSPIGIIGSVFHEFNNVKIFNFLQDKLSYIAFDPQGCFRHLSSNGKILFKEWWNQEILDKIDCLKISEKEALYLNIGERADEIINNILDTSVSSVLLTRGEKGSILGVKNNSKKNIDIYNIPAYPSKIMDETGAGDVFMFCYVIYLCTHNDNLNAAAFATSIASIMIEQNRFSWRFNRELIELRQKLIFSQINKLKDKSKKIN